MTTAPTSPATTARVPAKVNLELLVGPPRGDGFHALSTVYQAVGIYDEVTVRDSPRWRLTCDGALSHLVPLDETNLALRAARALAEHAGIDACAEVHVTKEIPVAGGMAGGSADAAAALVALDHHWGLRTPRTDLESLAAALGSDVPFLLQGGTAIGSGRGELITPVLTRGRFHWLFALSRQGLATPSVYAELDRQRAGREVPDPEPSPRLMAALRSGDTGSLAASLGNDLQEAALSLRPDLADILEAGLSHGALGGIVSGSGPTVAFLCAGHEAAIDLALALVAAGVGLDVTRAAGPVAGAQVVSSGSGR